MIIKRSVKLWGIDVIAVGSNVIVREYEIPGDAKNTSTRFSLAQDGIPSPQYMNT
jgi:hypothetical protein